MSTFSVVCGNRACNAACPFCISKMTEGCTDGLNFDYLRFKKAARYVAMQGVPTALITGRGEPTLHITQLSGIVSGLDEYFPCIELQTNGIQYKNLSGHYWHELQQLGLNTICISVCSLDDVQNRTIMGINDDDFKVTEVIRAMVDEGFTVRISFQLNTIAVPRTEYSAITIVDSFNKIIQDAQQLGAQQITFRLIGKPEESANREAIRWVDKYGFEQNGKQVIETIERCGGKKIATYHWGGLIFDVRGISVCVADCLTEDPGKFEPRSWIFDGKHLKYSWQHKGAIVF